MGYICATCAGCDNHRKFDGCVDIALEFVMDNNESVFVKALWDGDECDGVVAAFEIEREDGSRDGCAAVPRWLLVRDWRRWMERLAFLIRDRASLVIRLPSISELFVPLLIVCIVTARRMQLARWSARLVTRPPS